LAKEELTAGSVTGKWDI